jgi:hypothetical protein
MKGFDKPGVIEESGKKRQQGSLLGDLGDRLSKTFSSSDKTETSVESNGRAEPPFDAEQPLSPERVAPRFSIVRQGYDCDAVDEYVAELEQELIELDRELAELQAQAPSGGEVKAEIEKVGEQTSQILLAAHEQANETTRRAQAEADRCISDAASNAVKITEDANRQLRQLETDKRSIRGERARLLDDVRGLATALSMLADDASHRFPPEPDGGQMPEIKVSKAVGEHPFDE